MNQINKNYFTLPPIGPYARQKPLPPLGKLDISVYLPRRKPPESIFSKIGVYVGETTENHIANGFGTLRLNSGGSYTGEFRDGEYHGWGTLKKANGHSYSGQFKEGDFDGKGTFTYANGNIYTGEFKDGHIHGRGMFIYVDGRVYEGVFEKGKPVSLTRKRDREPEKKVSESASRILQPPAKKPRGSTDNSV